MLDEKLKEALYMGRKANSDDLSVRNPVEQEQGQQ
jgi:hypothetical protein